MLATPLDHPRRLIGTAVSFATFGLGGLVLSLSLFPALTLAIRNKDRRAEVAQRTINTCFWLFTWLMEHLGVMDKEILGAEKLREDHGCLIVANHPTLIDVVVIKSLLERSQCIVKHENWRNPFMRSALVAANYVRNDDDPLALVERCTDTLKAGNNLIIFPEGSRTVPGRERRFQRGFANVALAACAPIRLITISCTPITLTKGTPWYQIPARRSRFRVCVHEKFRPHDVLGDCPPTVATRRLTQHIKRRFEELLDDERARDENQQAYH